MAENPPETPDLEKLNRNILASNPRVTKFKINWEDPNAYKSPLLDENIPPIPNAPPPHKDPCLQSPLKNGLAHLTEESNHSMKSNESNEMDLAL
jgi:histone chaperone ASF1